MKYAHTNTHTFLLLLFRTTFEEKSNYLLWLRWNETLFVFKIILFHIRRVTPSSSMPRGGKLCLHHPCSLPSNKLAFCLSCSPLKSHSHLHGHPPWACAYFDYCFFYKVTAVNCKQDIKNVRIFLERRRSGKKKKRKLSLQCDILNSAGHRVHVHNYFFNEWMNEWVQWINYRIVWSRVTWMSWSWVSS